MRFLHQLRSLWARFGVFGWLIVPAVALIEMVAHARIVRAVPKPEHWIAAHDWIAHERRPTDLVGSAPFWTDPLSRLYFGDLISLKDAARMDATGYPRAFVATIRNGVHPDFEGWTQERSQSFGPVIVRVLRNPHPVNVLFDFVDNADVQHAMAFRVEAGQERPCQWATGIAVTGGGLHQGPLAGPDRFNCGEGWNNVGRTVIDDMAHHARRCVWLHPVVDVPMRITYNDVPIGAVIHGRHGIAYQAERGGEHGEVGADVTMTVRIDGNEIGNFVHHDGDGWEMFEVDTRAFQGTRHRVSFESTMPVARAAHYCFAGDTR